jgi:hypothetical protein
MIRYILALEDASLKGAGWGVVPADERLACEPGPIQTRGFHADNRSEYVKQRVPRYWADRASGRDESDPFRARSFLEPAA